MTHHDAPPSAGPSATPATSSSPDATADSTAHVTAGPSLRLVEGSATPDRTSQTEAPTPSSPDWPAWRDHDTAGGHGRNALFLLDVLVAVARGKKADAHALDDVSTALRRRLWAVVELAEQVKP